MTNTKLKNLRFQAAKFFLTYPKCDAEPADVLPQCGKWATDLDNGIHKYAIVQEFHKNGLPHLHIILCFNSRVDTVPSNLFDVVGATRTYHGNYKPLVSEPHAFRYLNKEYAPLHNYTEEEVDKLLEDAKKPLQKPKKNKLDWGSISTRIMSGEPVESLLNEIPELFMHLEKITKNLAVYKRLKMKKPERLKELNNFWYWGPTGSSKSKTVEEKYPNAYTKTKDEWYNDYWGEEVMHIPDIDGTWFYMLGDLKNVADYYVIKGRCKLGEPIQLRPKTIVCTSNYTIRECYQRYFTLTKQPWDEELVKAIERRFKEIHIPLVVNPDPLDVFPNNYFVNHMDEDLGLFDITYDKLFD